MPALSRVLHIVGSDVAHFSCPRCGGHDRERHVFLYMQATGLLDRMLGATVVHFAPEAVLSHWIQAAKPARYLRCDLNPQSETTQRMDITAMSLGPSSVDLLIANHVLEHVPDEHSALHEIHRVLKPGGLAVLQTPYSERLHCTWEDPGITGEEARLQAYGQEDHVRLYGRDIFRRFEHSGLRARTRAHAELLPGIDADRYGINPQEPFMCFEKTTRSI